MEATLSKILVLKIKKTQTNKTLVASKQKFKTYFGVFWCSFIKLVSFLGSIHSH